MGASEVETYLTHLAVGERASSSHRLAAGRVQDPRKKSSFRRVAKTNTRVAHSALLRAGSVLPEKGDWGEESAGLTHIKQP
jgi:hypothetical protein